MTWMTPVMTCTECLRLVATADVAELTTAGAVREHCRTCTDCATLVDEVAEESRRLADALDGTLPGVAAHVVALQAVAGAARGRRRGRRLRTALAVVLVLVASLVALALRRVVPAGAASVEVRNVTLHCLAPEQAAELARLQLPSRVEVTTSPVLRLPILTLRGPSGDVAAAEQLIARIDARWSAEGGAYCAAGSAGSAGSGSSAGGSGGSGRSAAPSRASR